MKISVLVPTLGTREREIRRLLETLEKHIKTLKLYL